MSRPEPRDDATESPSSWVREHRYAVGLGIVFMIAGAIGAPYLFPELPTARAALGGVLFGAFCSVAAAARRFLSST